MQTLNQPNRILLVYLGRPRISRSEMEKDITEMWQLVETLGNSSIVEIITQHGSTYIGSGKADEIIEYLKSHPIDTVLISGILKPNQKFSLIKQFWGIRQTIQVWDRIDLILAIFSQHARTTEATLQIELARIRHMGPRIFGMGHILSRQGGGIGTRGIGETNTELMERHWKREIQKVRESLDKLTETRKRQIEHRKQLGIPTISIVGYTNAGKTSLFNMLTHKKHLVENALFATLDSTVGELFIPSLQKKVIISDTIGFISNLPPDLIEAFTSTLMESVHADMILHVIDAADQDIKEKIHVVENILDHLHIPQNKEIYIYNKIDLIKLENREKLSRYANGAPYIYISTKTEDGIQDLISHVFPRFLQHENDICP